MGPLTHGFDHWVVAGRVDSRPARKMIL